MLDRSTDLFTLIFRGQAKPSKKAKLNKPVDDSNPSEPEKQSEPSNPIAEATLDDPPPQDHEVSIDHMGIDPVTDKPPSPAKVADDKTDDVMVTRVGYTASGNPTVLSQHSAKEETSAVDKGKWKTDSGNYTQFSAHDLHSGLLNRLYTSCDFEAGLINLMKERYEVNAATPYTNILPLATKVIGHDRIECAVNFQQPLKSTPVDPKGRFIL